MSTLEWVVLLVGAYCAGHMRGYSQGLTAALRRFSSGERQCESLSSKQPLVGPWRKA